MMMVVMLMRIRLVDCFYQLQCKYQQKENQLLLSLIQPEAVADSKAPLVRSNLANRQHFQRFPYSKDFKLKKIFVSVNFVNSIQCTASLCKNIILIS